MEIQSWLDFAKGPLFIATFSLMVIGLGRLLFLEFYHMVKAWLNMQDRNIPWRQTLKDSVEWVIPVRRITRVGPILGTTSFIFHVGLIVTPIFLLEHILLWKSGVGVGWKALSATMADSLTLLTILAGLGLLSIRIFHRPARAISRLMDYMLLVFLLVPFISGYLAMHPQLLFTSIQTMLLVHILSGELVFALIPFTKLSHVVLFPFGRISSDFYWRFPADGPDQVAEALHGKEVKA